MLAALKELKYLLDDPYLVQYKSVLKGRKKRSENLEKSIRREYSSLLDISLSYNYFGLHKEKDHWVFREWAPNATHMYLVGMFSSWKELEKYRLKPISDNGIWEIQLPLDTLKHGDLYRLRLHWKYSSGDRIPAFAQRVVQDPHSHIFNAQVWDTESYMWQIPQFVPQNSAPTIYEAHVGMASEEGKVATYREFQDTVLPIVKENGYNTIQLMAIAEHPYYGSFGYHVSSFFAPSSRFGTPEELKSLIDEAHKMGIAVIIDLVHSHSVKNEVEGLSCFDGTYYQYFHDGDRGNHDAWDSRCFDYGKLEVLRFLLSNCRYWLEEFNIDGFRFDGITSMLYHHRGLNKVFTSYEDYFENSHVDEEAIAYLTLANKLIHKVKPHSITVAEDISGMPGLAAPIKKLGMGFDYRMAMGVTDYWFKLCKDIPDESWDMTSLWHHLTDKRKDEKTISYVECHDQSLVGGKTLMFEMADATLYSHMHNTQENILLDRALALHKLTRLATLATAGDGYLNFMGNEFGHPEWIDFPREGNNWSYHHARRQWSLRNSPDVKYHHLNNFDQALIKKVTPVVQSFKPQLIALKNDDKVLAFERGGLYFFFNFHPTKSHTDYEVIVPQPGKYVLHLTSDAIEFAGQDRIIEPQSFFTIKKETDETIQTVLKLYLPSRVAIVLTKCDESEL